MMAKHVPKGGILKEDKEGGDIFTRNKPSKRKQRRKSNAYTHGKKDRLIGSK